MLGERVLQVWRWYLQQFRRYRKKTRGGLEIAPPSGARDNTHTTYTHGCNVEFREPYIAGISTVE